MFHTNMFVPNDRLDVFLELCMTIIMLFNPSKPSGKYMYHLVQQLETLHFVFTGFV
jgi:hypothetical protein